MNPKNLGSLDGLTLELNHARQRLDDLSGARLDEKRNELAGELGHYDDALDRIDQLEPVVARLASGRHNVLGVSDSAASRLFVLRSSISADRQRVAEQHQQRSEAVALRDHYARRVPALEAETEARRDQIKRLKGHLFSGFTRVGILGPDHLDRRLDLPLVIDQMRLNGGGSTASLSESVRSRFAERWRKGSDELGQWVEQNEVGQYAVQQIVYTFGSTGGGPTFGRHVGCLVYRVMPHREPLGKDGSREGTRIDQNARVIQTILTPGDVDAILHGKATNTAADLVDLRVLIDPETERVPSTLILSRPQRIEVFAN